MNVVTSILEIKVCMKLKENKAGQIKYQGLTWVCPDTLYKDQNWKVLMPRQLELTNFCVVNYGDEPKEGEPFSGWRLCSGGPLMEVGGWTNRDDAIINSTAWLVEYYKKECNEAIKLAEMQHTLLLKWLGSLKK